MESGAVVAVTLQPADRGDTETVGETLAEAGEAIAEVAGETNHEDVGERVNPAGPAEVVLDKGYHSSAVLVELAEKEVRSYCSEPDRGRRCWQGKPDEQAALYANRRRIRGARGKRLLRQRGETIERLFAHLYETGGLRRVHLRRHPNILKRLLVHVAAFNLGLVMRKRFGNGTPRGLQGYRVGLLLALLRRLIEVWALKRALDALSDDLGPSTRSYELSKCTYLTAAKVVISTTGCLGPALQVLPAGRSNHPSSL